MENIGLCEREKNREKSLKNQFLYADVDNATQAVHAHSHKHIIVIYLFGSRFSLHNEPVKDQNASQKKRSSHKKQYEKRQKI